MLIVNLINVNQYYCKREGNVKKNESDIDLSFYCTVNTQVSTGSHSRRVWAVPNLKSHRCESGIETTTLRNRCGRLNHVTTAFWYCTVKLDILYSTHINFICFSSRYPQLLRHIKLFNSSLTTYISTKIHLKWPK